MQNIAPNEAQELKYAAILLARGVGLAALAGAFWGLAELNGAFWILAVLGVFPALYAISLAALSAIAARNILCRKFNIVARPHFGFCVSAILLGCFLTLLLQAFLFGEGVTGYFLRP